MAFDPFLEENPRPKPLLHALGQDVSTLSIEELEERIEVLDQEIDRLKEEKTKKEASRTAASAFFKL